MFLGFDSKFWRRLLIAWAVCVSVGLIAYALGGLLVMDLALIVCLGAIAAHAFIWPRLKK